MSLFNDQPDQNIQRLRRVAESLGVPVTGKEPFQDLVVILLEAIEWNLHATWKAP